MIDWPQATYYILGICGGLLCAIAVYYARRVDQHDKVLSGLVLINALLQKHEVRLDAIDLSIHHLRESDHDIRGHLPSHFEKQEIDRRRNETHANFTRIFERLDEMKTERYQFHREIMDLLATKQDKPR